MVRASTQELQESLDQAFDLVEQQTFQASVAVDDEFVDEESFAEVAPPPTPKSSSLATYLGMTLLLASFALAVAPLFAPEAMLVKINALGLTPALLFLTGVMVTGLSLAQSANHQRAQAHLSGIVCSELCQVRQDVTTMIAEARSSTPGEQANAARYDEIVANYQKQDAMLGSLTKAVRMHNKPLVDLLGLANDILKKHEDAEKHLLGIKFDVEAIERTGRDAGTLAERRWEGLAQRMTTGDTEVEARLSALGKTIIEHLEPHILGESKRLNGELETQWELMREELEHGLRRLGKETREEVQTVARQIERIEAGGGSAEIGRLKSVIERLASGIEDGSHSAGSDPLALAQIQQGVGKLVRMVESMEHAPRPPQSAAESQPTSAPAAPKKTQAARAAPDKPSTSSTGKKGKHVLSAIERLKQMRGG